MRKQTKRRRIGPDAHRQFAQLATRQGGQVIQAGRYATTPEGVRGLAEGLGAADEVALEATGNTRAIATLLAGRAARVVVSNPAKTRAIAQAKAKTDKLDAEIPAQLLRLMTVPGINATVALSIVAAVGDFTRFRTPIITGGHGWCSSRRMWAWIPSAHG
jgi:transposase